MPQGERYCPAYGPGHPVCSHSICDCFIDQFPDDMEQAGALHPEFYTVIPPSEPVYTPHEKEHDDG